jgi:hypothetical protein
LADFLFSQSNGIRFSGIFRFAAKSFSSLDCSFAQNLPGGVGFATSSAKGDAGAVLVANLTRPG